MVAERKKVDKLTDAVRAELEALRRIYGPVREVEESEVK